MEDEVELVFDIVSSNLLSIIGLASVITPL